MEEAVDHSMTCRCWMGFGVPRVFCFLCLTLLKVGISVSVDVTLGAMLTIVLKSVFYSLLIQNNTFLNT